MFCTRANMNNKVAACLLSKRIDSVKMQSSSVTKKLLHNWNIVYCASVTKHNNFYAELKSDCARRRVIPGTRVWHQNARRVSIVGLSSLAGVKLRAFITLQTVVKVKTKCRALRSPILSLFSVCIVVRLKFKIDAIRFQIFKGWNSPKSIFAGLLPRFLLRKLSALPQIFSCIWGAYL